MKIKIDKELSELIEAKIIKRGDELLHLSCQMKNIKKKASKLIDEIHRLDSIIKECDS